MVGRRQFLGATGLGLLGGRAGGASAQEAANPGAGGKKAAAPARKALKPAPPTIPSPLPVDDRINRGLEEVRAKHSLPGMIGAVIRGDALTAIGAAGVRKLGAREPMRVGDLIHLGSDTKAMTATMIATLVEEGLLGWSSTIREVFPARARNLHSEFQKVTLWQLLTHRAGLPANGPWWELEGRTTTEKRRDLLSRMMKDAPESKPGTKYVYSNVGYALAGLMAEQATNRSWETLMRARLFEPLGMTSAGFGPPGARDTLDQPWGHHEQGGRMVPIQHDNAAALGPAGTVHCTAADWAKFIILHLRGDRGKSGLLTPKTFRFLHTPAPGTEYAGGWIVLERSWAGGTALTHSGSNTMWYCTVWVAPARDFAVLSVTNQGGDVAAKAVDESFGGLIPLALGAGPRGARRGRG